MSDSFAPKIVIVSRIIMNITYALEKDKIDSKNAARKKAKRNQENDARRKAGGFSETFVSKIITTIFKTFTAILKLLLMQADPVSYIKKSTGQAWSGKKVVAFKCAKTSVNEIKAACTAYSQQSGKNRTRFTVNDVILAALGGALSREAHERAQGLRTEQEKCLSNMANILSVPKNLLTAVWISLFPFSNMYKTPEEVPFTFGNSGLGTVYLTVPMCSSSVSSHAQNGNGHTYTNGLLHKYIKDGIKGVSTVHKRIDTLKGSPEPLVANVLLRLFGLLPPVLTRILWPHVAFKVSLSCSNVPGLQWPLYLHGTKCEIEEMFFFVPPQHTLSTMVCLCSYNNKVRKTLIRCARFYYMNKPTLTKF